MTQTQALIWTKKVNKSRKTTIKLPDEHWQKLDEYCEKLGADPRKVISSLAYSYLQTMIETGDLIQPEFPSALYRRFAPVSGTSGFIVEQVARGRVRQKQHRSDKSFPNYLRIIQFPASAGIK